MQLVKRSWLSTIVLATALSGGYVYAQGQGPGVGTQPPSNGTPRRSLEALSELRMLSQQLNLTPEQREKLRPIVTEEGEQLHDIRIDEHLQPDVKRDKVVAVREKYAPKISAELTPEQKEKFKKLEESLTGKKADAPKDAAAPAAPPK
jgi:Spy/CpxP family protein refolding chaperone